MNADGSGQTTLTNNTAGDYVPSFSPDDSKIAFTSRRDGNPEIYVMNADGSGQTRLTDNAAMDYYPSWGGVVSEPPVAAPGSSAWSLVIVGLGGFALALRRQCLQPYPELEAVRRGSRGEWGT